MDLVVLVPSWCCHEVLCSHLLIGVPLPKVTVLQYCHSVTAELVGKCRFMFACRIFLLLSEHTPKHNIVQRIIVIQSVCLQAVRPHRTVRLGHSPGDDFTA